MRFITSTMTFLSHMQVVHTLYYIHLTNKAPQSGSDNVIHSATAHTSD